MENIDLVSFYNCEFKNTSLATFYTIMNFHFPPPPPLYLSLLPGPLAAKDFREN